VEVASDAYAGVNVDRSVVALAVAVVNVGEH